LNSDLVEVCAEPARVLLVDDNVDLSSILVDMLRAVGLRVRAFADGGSALQTASHWRPDIALLNLALPGMDGFSVAERLKSLPGLDAIPIVALTGFADEARKRRAAEVGFTAYLVKPVLLDDVVRLIRQLTAPS
jgi:two-component system, chemotaxis family, CheB/CheR fusion protein